MQAAAEKTLTLLAAGYIACGISLACAQPGPQALNLSASDSDFSGSNSIDNASFDNFRPADYERLLAEAMLAIEDQDYTTATQTISDALQIIKVNHGLISTEQFPALQLLAETYLAQQNWQALDRNLAYFEWLLNRLGATDFEAYLSGTEVLNRLYLCAAADTNSSQNAHYLIAAKQLNWRAITALEQRYGKQHLRIAPWLYNIVLAHYYQSTLTKRRGMTSYDYKSNTTEIISGWSLSKNESLQQSYGIGQELLQRIREIYASSSLASAATDALTLVYLADWELLFEQGDVALEHYRMAYKILQNAQTDAADLETWFAQPLIIPRPEFEDSWQAHLQDPDDPVSFSAWSLVFPGVHTPPGLAGKAQFARFQFTATARLDLKPSIDTSVNEAGANKFFYTIHDLTIEAVTPSHDLVKSQARNQISRLQFRPLLLGGNVQSGNNIRLNYVFSDERDLSMLSDAN